MNTHGYNDDGGGGVTGYRPVTRDDVGENVYHVTGPPGTGKTQYLAEQTRKAVLDRGRRVAIASLTNTAANEIRERTGLRDQSMVRVGTLHRLCMDAIGVRRDQLVASHLDAWNDHAQTTGHPDWILSDKDGSPEEGRAGETRGDQLLATIEDGRHRCLPPETWPQLVGLAEFHAAYHAWKQGESLFDFTDLIESASHGRALPPIGDKDPDTIVIDECQDSTRLELRLVREAWAPDVERVILCGDPDQTLYSFRSADPRVFTDFPLPPDHSMVLAQSYRVPRAVHARALATIRRITDREDVAYRARDSDGEVIEHTATACYPDPLLRDLPSWLADGTVMFLAPTQYGLRSLIGALRREGIPYANPWAPDRGDWNPIRRARKGQLSTLDRMLAFLAHGSAEWTREQILAWVPMLQATGTLARGALSHLGEKIPDPWTSESFRALFVRDEDALHAYDADLPWLLARTKPALRRPLEYLARVHERQGVDALIEEPQVQVGTVHAVKGASAETVIVFPDVTPAMYRAQTTREGMDAQTRTIYVAMTRARSRLVLASPSGRRHYPL